MKVRHREPSVLVDSDMLLDSISVPFSIQDAFGGFGTAEGIFHFEDNKVKLELDSKFLGFIDTGIRELTFTLDQLVSIQFHKGWFNKRLILQARRLKTFEGITGAKQGKLELCIARADADKAEQFASVFQSVLTTREMDRLKDQIDSI